MEYLEEMLVSTRGTCRLNRERPRACLKQEFSAVGR